MLKAQLQVKQKINPNKNLSAHGMPNYTLLVVY